MAMRRALRGDRAARLRSRCAQLGPAVVVVAVLPAVVLGATGGPVSSNGSSLARAVGGWRPLPPAPVAGRLGEGFVWTGRELVIAGGVTRTRTGTARLPADGAAYEPATRRWRVIAVPPGGVGAGAVWTGRRLVVWTGNGPAGPAAAASYDPVSDTWRRLAAGPLGPREGNANLWTGKELLVIGGYRGDAAATPVAAALDPATGRWRTLHGLHGLSLFGGPNGAVWDGHEAIVAGKLSLCPQLGSACSRTRPVVVAYDPATDRKRELGLPPFSASFGAGAAGSLTPVAWTRGTVIFRALIPGSLRVLGYRPSTGRWRIGPRAPCVLPHGTDTQTAWIGDRLVAACADGGLQIYDPKSESWRRRTSTTGVSPLATRTGSAIAWTGRELVVWSGWTFERFNPTPASGASMVLAR